MNKVVFLSWAYPPMRLPRAIQVARLAEHLGRPVEVICGDVRTSTTATGKPTTGNDRLRLTRIARPPWWRYIDAALARSVPAALATPDPYWNWARRAARHILNDIALTPHDAFVSFGQPMSDHLAGLQIKRARNVTWFAHFSDPWSDNPLVERGAISMGLNRRMERKVIESADRVIMTADQTVELVMAKYPEAWRAKVSVLPHAFDDAAFPARSKRAHDDDLVVRYLGNFYGQRTPQPLLNGLKAALRRNAKTFTGARFELIGAFGNGLLDTLDWSGLPRQLVEIKPAVSYDASLRLMVEADALLVIDAPAEVSVFLPSKLIEYVGAGRPILGITPPGAAADLISSLGGPTADPADPEAIAIGLARLIELARQQDRNCIWGVPEVRSGYAAPTIASRFGALIDTATDAR